MDFDGTIFYEGSYEGKRVVIKQEIEGNSDWWIARYGDKYLYNSNEGVASYQSPEEAYNEMINIIKDYKRKKKNLNETFDYL